MLDTRDRLLDLALSPERDVGEPTEFTKEVLVVAVSRPEPVAPRIGDEKPVEGIPVVIGQPGSARQGGVA